MANIFINGLNAKAGGGKSIFNNYLKLLEESNLKQQFIVLAPNIDEYKKYSSDNISIITLPVIYNHSLAYPLVYNYYLNTLLKKYGIDIVFNLADIPIRTTIKQVFLFDWPYAAYPESVVWKTMDLKSKIIRKTKFYFFKKNLKYISSMIAQTSTMSDRLRSIYGLSAIEVVPNAVSLDNLECKSNFNFNLPEGIKLLYLTHYYPHKNIEIFIPLAKKIRDYNLSYKLITTIHSNQHQGAKLFLDEIRKNNLEDIIVNIGPVKMEQVPALYKQCDGLLMPTLLESFSGTYVEAMYHKIPIFTSNIDFATGVCKDAAVYFDPFDPESIIDSLNRVFNNTDEYNKRVSTGSEVLNQLPNWEQTFDMYNRIIEQT